MVEKTEKEKTKKVVVKYNGPSLWVIDYPGRGMQTVRPGEEVALNPKDTLELRALLTIIKEANNPRTNVRIAMTKPTKDGYQEQMKIARFEIVSGRELLPSVLQKHSYSENKLLKDDEVSAIEELCPDFFKQTSHRPSGPQR